MDNIFRKLNFKGHENVLVVNPPDSFKDNIEAMSGLTKFSFDI